MANTINPYDPIFYANEALIQLEKSLGMAARVHRGYDKDAQQPGSTIQIRRPGTFTASDAPSVAQDLNPTSLTIQLNFWREVKFALTDKELNTAGERIITDHIRPAAVALADDIDQKLAALYVEVPWATDVTVASAAVSDIVAARTRLFNNRVPMSDLHGMVDGNLEGAFLGLQAFSQWQGAGDTGVNTQMRGTLGTKFGIEWFANQNTPTHTSATVADLAGAVNNVAGYAVGSTSILVDGFTASAALKAGDIVVFTGHTQQYNIAADVTLDGTGAGTITITPALKDAALVDNQVATVQLSGGSGTTKTQNLVFHRNAFALAMAPLSTMARELGARVETVVDPITGLAIRSRIFYIGDTSKIYVALDVLYGVKVLDPNLAMRMRAA